MTGITSQVEIYLAPKMMQISKLAISPVHNSYACAPLQSQSCKLVKSAGKMSNQKHSRRILYWLAAIVGWYVYAAAVSVMTATTAHWFSFTIYLLLLVLPILVAFCCWVYVQGPANLSRRLGDAAKALFHSRAA
jgi:hypothetical protein